MYVFDLNQKKKFFIGPSRNTLLLPAGYPLGAPLFTQHLFDSNQFSNLAWPSDSENWPERGLAAKTLQLIGHKLGAPGSVSGRSKNAHMRDLQKTLPAIAPIRLERREKRIGLL